MKHRTLLFSVSIVLLLVVNVVNVPGKAASLSQQAVVYFAEPIAVEIALEEAAHYGLRVLMLQHSIPIMEQDIQGGYFPEPTNTSGRTREAIRTNPDRIYVAPCGGCQRVISL